MGQRANLILVEGNEYQLFYNHWCANTLPRDLFWGPDHALAFIRIQRAVDDSGWLDDIWAEGGALLDLDRKHFLLYGGEEVRHNVPLRRIYLELLTQVWTGWSVRWAYEGIADLANYVGYPHDRVLSQGAQDSTDGTLTPPEEKDWTDLVASVRFDDGSIRLYPLAGDVASHLASGLKLAENIPAAQGLAQLFLDEWTKEFPSGGFHLDLSTQQLEFWVACDAPDVGNRVARGWPGWKTQWHHDQYERQLERAEGLLRFPLPERQTLLDRCRENLLLEPATSPVNTIKLLSEQERKQGTLVQINPWALHDDRLHLSRKERIAILDQAVLRLSPVREPRPTETNR